MNQEYKNIIAIDPGSHGGVFTYQNDKYNAAAMDMNNYQTVRNHLKHLKTQASNWIAFVETINLHVGKENIEGWPKAKITQYINETIGKFQRIQKLVRGHTGIINALIESEIDYVEVYPITWQSRMYLINRRKKETPTEKKNRHKKVATDIYKVFNISLTHDTADAGLILAFAQTILSTNDPWLNGRVKRVETNLFSQ